MMTGRAPPSGPVRVPAPRLSETLPPRPPRLPSFTLEVRPPDLSRWLAGNTGIAGVHQFRATTPGPHVAITALMHGNEYTGAIVLDELLQQNIRPTCGALTLVFLNIDAFLRFDPENPTASRYVDEDMNRLWTHAPLSCPVRSVERSRVHDLLPVFDTVDTLLDLHSMLWPADPLMLSGPTDAGRSLAEHIGTPSLVVSDRGHATGLRLIDYARFVTDSTRARACLLEAGQHWAASTVACARATVARFLAINGIGSATVAPVTVPRFAEVTEYVTAKTASLTFSRNYRGGEIIPHCGTVIALDGPDEIRTPYDDCMLIMPNLRTARGHTAVRLARERFALV